MKINYEVKASQKHVDESVKDTVSFLEEWLQTHDKELLQTVDLLANMSTAIKSLEIRVEELEAMNANLSE